MHSVSPWLSSAILLKNMQSSVWSLTEILNNLELKNISSHLITRLSHMTDCSWCNTYLVSQLDELGMERNRFPTTSSHLQSMFTDEMVNEQWHPSPFKVVGNCFIWEVRGQETLLGIEHHNNTSILCHFKDRQVGLLTLCGKS